MTQTFGQSLGWGRNPLLLVIDVTRAFTEPDRPLGSDATPVVTAANTLIEAARAGNLPVMFTRVAYENADLSDAGLWSKKIGSLGDLVDGGEGVAELDGYLRGIDAFTERNLAANLDVEVALNVIG